MKRTWGYGHYARGNPGVELGSSMKKKKSTHFLKSYALQKDLDLTQVYLEQKLAIEALLHNPYNFNSREK